MRVGPSVYLALDLSEEANKNMLTRDLAARNNAHHTRYAFGHDAATRDCTTPRSVRESCGARSTRKVATASNALRYKAALASRKGAVSDVRGARRRAG